MNPEQISQALLKCELFRDLSEDEIAEIAGLCEVMTLDAGEYLFEQGDFGEQIYAIVSGKIFLERLVTLGDRKGSVIIGTLGKGRICGCWSTLMNEPHILMSSASCQKPATLLAIRGSVLRKIMTENMETGFKIMERLCFLLRDRIRSAYGAMENI